jgi:nitrate/nitrite-specific signal transduction histidine kinase
MNLRPKLTEEIYKARIATLEGQVEKVVETAEEEREKHAKEILGYVSARNNLVLHFQRKLKVQWLKLFLVVLAAVIVGLCVSSGVGYAISHLNSVV